MIRSQTAILFREICRIKQLFVVVKTQRFGGACGNTFKRFIVTAQFFAKMGKTIIVTTLVARSSVLGSRDWALLRIYKSFNFNKSFVKRAW